MPLVIVDTNVAVVANGAASQVNRACVMRCLQELVATRDERQLLLDDVGLILDEYLKRKPHGFPQGPGDAFFVWVHDNQANPSRISSITITPLINDPREFAEFPDDAELEAFDRDDKKFVAVALASGRTPPILNATDTDWWIHRAALTRNGIRVEFLCPELMKDKK